ncbi:HAD-IA family hydrolase [Granulosicoccus sp. 3-233]|uniref:HAD-IA family hydrolase n=1 Tax=Granulosicoccus sp. 3-233 TaxID=3417969 RepID=UPI003D348C07
MSSPHVEALLFDMGGVVLEVDFGKVFQAMEGLSALPLQAIRQRFSMDEAYRQHERGLLGEAAYLQHLREQLKLDAADADIVAAWNAIFGDEITEALDAIQAISHRYPCDGFTNTNATHQVYWDTVHPRIRQTFRHLFVSSEIGLRKPDAEAFEYISRSIGTPLQNILFFDDTPENIEGAARVGLQTVLVESPRSVIDAVDALP